MKAIVKIMIIVVTSIFLSSTSLYSCSSLVKASRSSVTKDAKKQCKNGLIILGSLPPALAPLVFECFPELGCAFGKKVLELHVTPWNALNPTWILSRDATVIAQVTVNGECIYDEAPGESYMTSYAAMYDTDNGDLLCEPSFFYDTSYNALVNAQHPLSITWESPEENVWVDWDTQEVTPLQEQEAKKYGWSKKIGLTPVHVPYVRVYSAGRGRVVLSRNTYDSLIESELWLLPNAEDIQPHVSLLPGSQAVLAACVVLAKKQVQKELRRKRAWQLLKRLSWVVRL